MSINNQNTYLNIEDAHLRLRTGNVYAQGITIGGITVDPSHGLQRVSDTGNATTNTLQFDNATTAFTTTANITVGRDLTVTGNATVSSNLTVTGNAVISDDLTVTENLLVSNNLTVTGNTFYTNPAAVLVGSNVVTEYTGPHDRPLRKYPEVLSPGTGLVPVSVTTPFTGLTQSWNGYEITMSSRWDSSGTYNGDHTFDDNESSIWLSRQTPATYDSNGDATSEDTLNGVDGSYLIMKLPKAIKPLYANIKTRDVNSSAPRHPKTGKFYGSNDGSSWTEIGTFSYGSIPSSIYYQKFNLVGTNTYQYIAIQVHTVFNDSGPSGGTTTSVMILELQYYGYEEGSGSLDTTLKSVYNVPATTGTQLEVYYDGRETSSYSGSETTVTDISPNTNNGTLNGGVGFDTMYKAFTFDGSGDYIRTSTLPSVFENDPNLTQSVWVYFNELSFTRSSGSDFNSVLVINASGQYSIGTINELGVGPDGIVYHSSGARGIKTSNPIVSDNWYHITVTKTPGNTGNETQKIYINGVLVPQVPWNASGTQVIGANPFLTIGGSGQSTPDQQVKGSIANFRLYSKALNADQVKELYDYQKDYFLGSKSQVTLYKGHLGVGVTEPSGQLELAGDERIQEYPPRGMTNTSTYIEGHGVFKAYGFQPHASYPAWKAFDDTATNSVWYSDGLSEYSGTGDYSGSTRLAPETVKGAYIVLEMPYEIVLKQIKFWQQINGSHVWDRGVYYAKCNPTDEWTAIHNVTDRPADDDTPYVAYITDPRPYKYFAIVITRRHTADATNGVSIRDLQFFGTPGPTTLDKGSLSLTRSLDVPRVSRYDVDTETPRPEKLVLDFDTTVNSSPTDISGQGNHGTFVNGASYSPGDKAFRFVPGTNGTNNGDHIQATLNTTTGPWAHSLSVWIKLDDANANGQALMGIGSTATGKNSVLYLYAGTSATTRELQYSNQNTDSLIVPNGTINFVAGRWYHIVLTTNAGTISSSNQKMYVDGVEQPTTVTGTVTSGTLNLDANDNLFIGRQSDGYAGNWFDGLMSNYKIYNTVLEPSEVRKLYNLGRTGRSMVISDTAVGIGKVPEAQLDVRGNLKVSGTISSNSPGWSYWRNSSADINDVIYNSATDGPVGGFSTLASFSQNWETGISGSIADRGTGHNFNPTTGTYTAPEKGVYMVNFSFSIDNGGGGDDSMYVQFQTAGNSGGGGGWETGGAFVNRTSSTNAYMLFNPEFSTRSGLEDCWSISDILLLDAGSTVNVRLENVSSSSSLTFLRCNFSGFKIA